jgi:hypothetical protein
MLNGPVVAGETLIEITGYGLGKYHVVTVKKVTTTGQIALEDGRRFNSQGLIIGGSYTPTRLEKSTPEKLQQAKRQDNLDYLSALKWNRFSDESLEAIVRTIKGCPQQEE